MLGPAAALGPPSTEALCSPISSGNSSEISTFAKWFQAKDEKQEKCDVSLFPDQASQEELQDMLLSCFESLCFIETEELLSAEQQHAPA